MTPVTLCMLDTRTVSHFLKKQPAVTRRVVAVPITALCISAITQGELLFVLAKRPDATALHEAVREFLRRVDVLPWDAATSEVHGPVRAAMSSEGRVLAPLDLLFVDRLACRGRRCRAALKCPCCSGSPRGRL